MSYSGSYFMFQSTLPAWGATQTKHRRSAPLASFNPRSPRGERQLLDAGEAVATPVSIHAPRVRSDFAKRIASYPRSRFNPRSPRGERLRLLRQQ